MVLIINTSVVVPFIRRKHQNKNKKQDIATQEMRRNDLHYHHCFYCSYSKKLTQKTKLFPQKMSCCHIFKKLKKNDTNFVITTLLELLLEEKKKKTNEMLQDKFKIKIRQQGAIATPYHQI
jgi:hypothetical protein